MKARAAYFASVDFLDEMLGDFLALLQHGKFLEDTVIIYTSDHGELCGEHGLWWKNTWHEASTRIPLIASLPEHRDGILPPTEIVEPVSLADLFPTICGLSNLAPPEGLDGIDLSSVLRGNKRDNPLDQRLGVITESLTPRWGKGTEFRMIRSERYKYVAFRGCNDLAFDLQEEPGEQRNLLATGEISPELTTLKSAVLDDFNFDDVAQACLRDTEQLRQKYPRRVTPKTPNQICLKDGRLVEADAPLYQPSVVSQNLSLDFDDHPTNS